MFYFLLGDDVNIEEDRFDCLLDDNEIIDKRIQSVLLAIRCKDEWPLKSPRSLAFK